MVCQLAGRLEPTGADWSRLVELMLMACAAPGAGPSGAGGRRYGGALGTAAPLVRLEAAAAGASSSNGSV
jgi:hypothetical protein